MKWYLEVLPVLTNSLFSPCFHVGLDSPDVFIWELSFCILCHDFQWVAHFLVFYLHELFYMFCFVTTYQMYVYKYCLPSCRLLFLPCWLFPLLCTSTWLWYISIFLLLFLCPCFSYCIPNIIAKVDIIKLSLLFSFNFFFTFSHLTFKSSMILKNEIFLCSKILSFVYTQVP